VQVTPISNVSDQTSHPPCPASGWRVRRAFSLLLCAAVACLLVWHTVEGSIGHYPSPQVATRRPKEGERGPLGPDRKAGDPKGRKSSDSSEKKRAGDEKMGKPVLRADESRPISNQPSANWSIDGAAEGGSRTCCHIPFSSLQIGNGHGSAGLKGQTGGHLENRPNVQSSLRRVK
jgi:hypothetical protein